MVMRFIVVTDETVPVQDQDNGRTRFVRVKTGTINVRDRHQAERVERALAECRLEATACIRIPVARGNVVIPVEAMDALCEQYLNLPNNAVKVAAE